MIKNASAALLLRRQTVSALSLMVLLVGLVGCEGPKAEVPSPYQGVVELEQRVLAFEVGGRLTAVGVQRGQKIQAGAPIASLDDALSGPTRAMRVAELDLARAQLAQLEAGARPEDLAAIKSQAASLRATERTTQTLLSRQRTLVTDKVAPPASLDELEGRLSATRAQRQALEHQLASAAAGARDAELAQANARIAALEAALQAEDLRQSKLTLHSPAAGVILERLVEPGEVVAPGTPIATLGDRDHPYVEVFVATSDLAPLRVGQGAEVLIDGLAPRPATIEHIADTTEFTPRYVFSPKERPHLVTRVRLRLEDPEHSLHPGLPAFARFPAQAATPSQALAP